MSLLHGPIKRDPFFTPLFLLSFEQSWEPVPPLHPIFCFLVIRDIRVFLFFISHLLSFLPSSFLSSAQYPQIHISLHLLFLSFGTILDCLAPEQSIAVPPLLLYVR